MSKLVIKVMSVLKKDLSKSEIKTMGDDHDLHLKTDVLLLADVIEGFRNMCLENFK